MEGNLLKVLSQYLRRVTEGNYEKLFMIAVVLSGIRKEHN
jgi:hypothetical protein